MKRIILINWWKDLGRLQLAMVMVVSGAIFLSMNQGAPNIKLVFLVIIISLVLVSGMGVLLAFLLAINRRNIRDAISLIASAVVSAIVAGAAVVVGAFISGFGDIIFAAIASIVFLGVIVFSRSALIGAEQKKILVISCLLEFMWILLVIPASVWCWS
jgi:hypothetical protein